MIGQVEMFDRRKGYGFISGDDGRKYFAGRSSIRIPSGCLDRGYTVSFVPTLGNRGYVAEDVRLL